MELPTGTEEFSMQKHLKGFEVREKPGSDTNTACKTNNGQLVMRKNNMGVPLDVLTLLTKKIKLISPDERGRFRAIY